MLFHITSKKMLKIIKKNRLSENQIIFLTNKHLKCVVKQTLTLIKSKKTNYSK